MRNSVQLNGATSERVEAAGFSLTEGKSNDDICNEVLIRLNGISEYVKLFGQVFPDVAAGNPINFDHFGKAIAEFEFT